MRTRARRRCGPFALLKLLLTAHGRRLVSARAAGARAATLAPAAAVALPKRPDTRRNVVAAAAALPLATDLLLGLIVLNRAALALEALVLAVPPPLRALVLMAILLFDCAPHASEAATVR